MYTTGKGGEVTKILMDGCDQDEDDVCQVYQGGAARGQVYFTSSSSAKELKCKLQGDIGAGWLPFPVDLPDGCSSLLEGSCPISAGDSIVYDIDLPIEPFFPQVSQTLLHTSLIAILKLSSKKIAYENMILKKSNFDYQRMLICVLCRQRFWASGF